MKLTNDMLAVLLKIWNEAIIEIPELHEEMTFSEFVEEVKLEWELQYER